jgi:hypothetical protein
MLCEAEALPLAKLSTNLSQPMIIKLTAKSCVTPISMPTFETINTAKEKMKPKAKVSLQKSHQISVVNAGANAGSEDGKFCVCGSLDDNPDETFIKCTIGTGGCNGWVHLSCSGLTESEIDSIVLKEWNPAKYVCKLCKPLASLKRRAISS